MTSGQWDWKCSNCFQKYVIPSVLCSLSFISFLHAFEHTTDRGQRWAKVERLLEISWSLKTTLIKNKASKQEGPIRAKAVAACLALVYLSVTVCCQALTNGVCQSRIHALSCSHCLPDSILSPLCFFLPFSDSSPHHHQNHIFIHLSLSSYLNFYSYSFLALIYATDGNKIPAFFVIKELEMSGKAQWWSAEEIYPPSDRLMDTISSMFRDTHSPPAMPTLPWATHSST